MRGDWGLRVMLGAAALLLCPWPRVVAPAWEITVVDERGEPVPYVAARQRWFDATAMEGQLERMRLTDEQGRAAFPRRVSWANTAERTVHFVRVISQDHATMEYASVYAWDVGYSTGVADYSRAEPLPTIIVMKADPCPPRPVAGRAARLPRSGASKERDGKLPRCIPG